ncbi:glucose-1-phosphate thymidylyltransferase RfbA [Magnetospirillum sp. 64-120]|uniref:glucose-1-phosphate thymidylyltransferase RfbA n=1 Tax=Magnetospirillum sp. 64-120 TaxID=1895778 RepID=UPI000929517C|nr:glucose-1-phosphate thymidylyltransferase RfbA [Magnetospirillum sp. 64-120]OJX70360.1 MAG: glucose-1-phosphate thymidylyltransferase [Magnetospirillum sp. 64-120]
MKGIILAGGTGSRLRPVTLAVCKQLLPVYDKPMVFYPLSVLMLAGVDDILLISTERDQPLFRNLLGDGSHLGIRLSYAVQERPAGLPQAFTIGAEHMDGQRTAMILGDNVFFGEGMGSLLMAAMGGVGAVGFCTRVTDPQRYGVVSFGADGKVQTLQEKPNQPLSDWAMTGLYVVDGDAPARAGRLKPSGRGELEMVDLLGSYLGEKRLSMIKVGRGYAWFDAGTHDSLLEASEFVRTVEGRQGLKVACLEEIALRRGFIDLDRFARLAQDAGDTSYGRYLQAVLAESRGA